MSAGIQFPPFCEEKFEVHIQANNRFKYRTQHNRISMFCAEFDLSYPSVFISKSRLDVLPVLTLYSRWYIL